MARLAAEKGDDGTNDVLVSEVIRTNELQVWFVGEHTVEMPLCTHASGLEAELPTSNLQLPTSNSWKVGSRIIRGGTIMSASSTSYALPRRRLGDPI